VGISDSLRATIERYNAAWNAHDLDAIMAIDAWRKAERGCVS